MEICKIEYLRKNGGVAVKLEDGTFVRHSKGKKRGVLFCGIHPDDADSVIVGFSMCNKLDEFDFVNDRRKPGFGLNIAKDRALKWTNHTDYFVQYSWTEDQISNPDIELLYLINPNLLNKDNIDYTEDLIIEIPPSIEKQLRSFIQRCKRYYQDKDFPVWANKLEEGKSYTGYIPFVNVRCPEVEFEDEGF